MLSSGKRGSSTRNNTEATKYTESIFELEDEINAHSTLQSRWYIPCLQSLHNQTAIFGETYTSVSEGGGIIYNPGILGKFSNIPKKIDA